MLASVHEKEKVVFMHLHGTTALQESSYSFLAVIFAQWRSAQVWSCYTLSALFDIVQSQDPSFLCATHLANLRITQRRGKG